MRKLKITELNRISAEEFKQAEKLPLVVVLDDIRSLHNIGSVYLSVWNNGYSSPPRNA